MDVSREVFGEKWSRDIESAPYLERACTKCLHIESTGMTGIGRRIHHVLCDSIYIYIYIKWTVFVNVTTKSAQHAHARMIAKTDLIHRQEIYITTKTRTKVFSYTLGREYRVMRNRYSRLLFTSEDRLCANLRVQEQSTNMTSQC